MVELVVGDGWTVEVTVVISTGSVSPKLHADRVRRGRANAAIAAAIRKRMAGLTREPMRGASRIPNW